MSCETPCLSAMDPKETPPKEEKQPPPSGKLFKKCKSATFQIDGATYTIGEFAMDA